MRLQSSNNDRYSILLTGVFLITTLGFLYFQLFPTESKWKNLTTENTFFQWLISSEGDIHLTRDSSRQSSSKLIYSLRNLFEHHSGVETLSIKGTGLTEIEWQQLNEIGINGQISNKNDLQGTLNALTGLVNVRFHSELLIGEQQVLSGEFISSDNKSKDIEINIIDGNGNYVASSNEKKFQLSWEPQNLSENYYEIQLKINEDLHSSYPVAFLVTRTKTLNALLLQSSPSFEFNHLRKWLSEQTFQVFSDVELSQQHKLKQLTPRENYAGDDLSLNTDDVADSKVKAENERFQALKDKWKSQSWNRLTDINLVVIEFSRLATFDEMEFERLKEFNHLGAHIVILMNRGVVSNQGSYNKVVESLRKQFNIEIKLSPNTYSLIPKGYTKLQSVDVSSSTQQLLQTGEADNEGLLPPLTIDGSQLISSSVELNTIVQTDGSQPLVSRLEQDSTITVSRILDSYQWRLSGQDIAYEKLWQTIIQQPQWVSYQPVANIRSVHLPTVDYPLIICSDFFFQPEPISLQTGGLESVGQIETIAPLSIGIAASSSESLQFQKSAAKADSKTEAQLSSFESGVYSRECQYVYPEATGWYHVVRGWQPMSQDIAFGQPERLASFYVYSKENWQEVMQHHKHVAKQKALAQGILETREPPINWRNFTRWFLLVLALVALSLLWLNERKVKS